VHPDVRSAQSTIGIFMSSEPESFLTRWSRRKRAAERETERPAESAAPEVPATALAKPGGERVAAGAPASTPAPVRDPAAPAEAALPPIESLDGLRSDYQAFFQQPVDEGLRRAALKKLFADPHFNQMDMLDVYVDDYTQFEPLPAALRMRLPSARAFLLDSERAALEAAEAPGDTPEASVAAAGAEGDLVDSLCASGEDRGFVMNDPSVEPTSELDATSHAAPADATSPVDPARAAEVSTAPAVPPGKATASDPSST
jgi:Protein of unknown function (DUF3306)